MLTIDEQEKSSPSLPFASKTRLSRKQIENSSESGAIPCWIGIRQFPNIRWILVSQISYPVRRCPTCESTLDLLQALTYLANDSSVATKEPDIPWMIMRSLFYLVTLHMFQPLGKTVEVLLVSCGLLT